MHLFSSQCWWWVTALLSFCLSFWLYKYSSRHCNQAWQNDWGGSAERGKKTDKIKEVEQKEHKEYTGNRKFHVKSKGESHEQWGSSLQEGKKSQQTKINKQMRNECQHRKGQRTSIFNFFFPFFDYFHTFSIKRSK